MNTRKIKGSLIMGFLLAYYGLKDIENFHILYQGFALAMSLAAFYSAAAEYINNKDQEN